MKYYSAIKKNTFESVLMRWMKQEPIIQSEVSQKEKHQYSILTHIFGISLEKETATHSSILAWKIPWTEEPGRLWSMGLLSQTLLSDFTFTFHFHALEKEMATHSSVLAIDGSPPGSAIPGVTQSRTRLKRLSSSSSSSSIFFCEEYPLGSAGVKSRDSGKVPDNAAGTLQALQKC